MAKDRGSHYTRNREEIESDPTLSPAAKLLFARLERNIEIERERSGAANWTGTMSELRDRLGYKSAMLRSAMMELERRCLVRVTRFNGTHSRYEVATTQPFASSRDVRVGISTHTGAKFEPVRNSNRCENRTGTGAKFEPVCPSSILSSEVYIVDDVAERVGKKGLGKSDLACVFGTYTRDRIEHAEAIADDLADKGQVKKSWSSVFLHAIRVGPDEWPLPRGVLTHSAKQAARLAGQRRQIERDQQRALAADREQAVRGWVDCIGFGRLRELFDALPVDQRRLHRNHLSPAAQSYLYQLHARSADDAAR